MLNPFYIPISEMNQELSRRNVPLRIVLDENHVATFDGAEYIDLTTPTGRKPDATDCEMARDALMSRMTSRVVSEWTARGKPSRMAVKECRIWAVNAHSKTAARVESALKL